MAIDVATLVGIVGGIGLFYWAFTSSGSIMEFVDVPSIIITVGGTFVALLIHYPLKMLLGLFKVVSHAFLGRTHDVHAAIAVLVNFAERARREGLLALEDSLTALPDQFLQKGLQLVVDGTDPELVRNILETEVDLIGERHQAGAQVFDTAAALAPAFGMVGTLIGLIAMLKSLDSPSGIGQGMAVALLTTLYGAFMANFIFIPLAGKLRIKSADELLLKEIMVAGILSIQAGESPRIVAEKLKSYISPNLRRQESGEPGVAAAPEGAQFREEV